MESTPITEVREQLDGLLAAAASTELPNCAAHGDKPADAACSECGRFFCWDDVSFATDAAQFVCEPCRHTRAARAARRNLWSWLKEPFFYVGLSVVLAAIAYMFGVGNPSPHDLVRRDQHKPWYLRRAGKLWLAQADRAKARVVMLENGARTEDTKAWARLAAKALGNAATQWRQTEAEPDLRLGQAMMFLRAGNAPKAFELLIGLEDLIPPEHALWCHYLHCRAKAALALGKTRLAEEHWRILLATVEQAETSRTGLFGDFLDPLVDFYSKDRAAALCLHKVRSVCDTGTSLRQLREEAIRELRRNGLPVPPSLLDKSRQPDFGEPARQDQNTPETEDDTEPQPPKKKVTIERF
jgi:hypothetical protein